MSSDDFQKKMNSQTDARNDVVNNLELMTNQLFGETNADGFYDPKELEQKYRKLALKFHPDRNGGDNRGFNMLKLAFENAKSKIPEFYEEKRIEKKFESHAPPPDELFDSKFDQSKFNQYFDNNSFKKKAVGYSNWMKNVEDVKEVARPSEHNFNSAFVNNKKKMMNSVDPKYLQLMKRNEIPDERYTSHRGVVIGEEEDENTDFTGVAEGGSLNYTDIRRALELTHLVDEDDVDKKTSGDVMKDFSKMKSNAGRVESMSQAEQEAYNSFLSKKREEEDARKYRASVQDEEYDMFFQRTQSNRIKHF
jgi:curved DNA-binding protein CbpA